MLQTRPYHNPWDRVEMMFRLRKSIERSNWIQFKIQVVLQAIGSPIGEIAWAKEPGKLVRTETQANQWDTATTSNRMRPRVDRNIDAMGFWSHWIGDRRGCDRL
jgi:hypothetical protein